MATLTLRNASRISSEARNIVNSLIMNLNTSTDISVHSTDVAVDLNKAREVFALTVNTILNLEDAAARLRICIGHANAKEVDELLGRDASIQRKIKFIENDIISNRQSRYTTATEVEKEVLEQREVNKSSERYSSRRNTISALAITEEVVEFATEQLKTLKVDRQRISNKLLELNINTKISINDNDIELFRAVGVTIVD